jgi:hypothetical protein
MRVPARIIGTEKLVREMDEAVYQQISEIPLFEKTNRLPFVAPDFLKQLYLNLLNLK